MQQLFSWHLHKRNWQPHVRAMLVRILCPRQRYDILLQVFGRVWLGVHLNRRRVVVQPMRPVSLHVEEEVCEEARRGGQEIVSQHPHDPRTGGGVVSIFWVLCRCVPMPQPAKLHWWNDRLKQQHFKVTLSAGLGRRLVRNLRRQLLPKLREGVLRMFGRIGLAQSADHLRHTGCARRRIREVQRAHQSVGVEEPRLASKFWLQTDRVHDLNANHRNTQEQS
mmetsp:Transcript_107201/g.311398  ORF Transcript_107201/g.311398 Transcript_107201/m.311398 type:complete len:222 (-) Transcript_107201:600-1265(-)